MCDVKTYRDKLDALEGYLEFVNTDIEENFWYEPPVYAAYAAYHDLSIPTIQDWYRDASVYYLTSGDPEEYFGESTDRLIKDGSLYECGGYWFY